MTYVLAAALIVLLAGAILLFRYLARRHVASLFRTTVRKLMEEGAEIEPAMREAVRRLTRRAPFNIIGEDEYSFFFYTLQDLGSPVEVGAEILQKCESRDSALEVKDRLKMARLAYSTDLKLNLSELVQNARTLHRKVPHRYPNITLALLAALSVREGWTFVEEQGDALIYDYKQERVRIPKKGSGKDAARLILFEEMAHRPMLVRPDTDFEVRKNVRKELLDHFDALFEEAFVDIGG